MCVSTDLAIIMAPIAIIRYRLIASRADFVGRCWLIFHTHSQVGTARPSPSPSGCPSTWPVNAVMCLMSRRAGPVRNLGRSSRSLCVICTLAWAFSRHRFSCPPGEALRWSEGNFGCNLHMELFKSYCAKVPQSHLFLRLEFGSFAAGEAPVLMDTFINSLG